MRDETAEWLLPLMQAAEERHIEVLSLVSASTMPAVEADSPHIDALVGMMPEGADLRAVDWVRFGRLLRHELRWDNTYPDCPQERPQA